MSFPGSGKHYPLCQAMLTLLRQLLPAIPAIMLAAPPGRAERMSPGKYTGTVVFDRRDACILYSGLYFPGSHHAHTLLSRPPLQRAV